MEPIFDGEGIVLRDKYLGYIEILKKHLTQKRFFHSLAVAKEALRLAEKYGADGEKAFLAGLLHDICKDMPQKQQLQLFDEFGIILGAVEKGAPKLWHSILGAAYIEKILKINDAELISAVRYHTSARADMSLLEKIIYLADFTSEDRDYSGVEDMRIAVDKGLEYAMSEALSFTVDDLNKKGMVIHEDTLAAYREYAKN